MAIKSSTFGRVELTGKEAARFLKIMNHVKPDKKVKEAADKGREILARIRKQSTEGTELSY